MTASQAPSQLPWQRPKGSSQDSQVIGKKNFSEPHGPQERGRLQEQTHLHRG